MAQSHLSVVVVDLNMAVLGKPVQMAGGHALVSLSLQNLNHHLLFSVNLQLELFRGGLGVIGGAGSVGSSSTEKGGG